MLQPPAPATPQVEPPSAEPTLPPGYRTFAIRLAPPTLTYIFIGACLAVFFLEIGYGYLRYNTWTGSENVTVLIDLGAKVNELIVLGEVWRLFTAMFLHIGVMHLLFNMWALYAIGRLVEAYYGHVRYAIIYLFGGLFGSLASFAFSLSVSAGASGAVFALTGAAAVYFFRYRENFGAHGRAVLQNMVLIIAVNLAFGLAGSGVDNWGHIGGLAGGLLLGWGLLPYYAPPRASATAAGAIRLNTAYPIPADRDEPMYMEVAFRPAAEVAALVVVTLIFVAGYYLATQINVARYPGLSG